MKPHSDVLDAIFESEKMKALASFQDLYGKLFAVDIMSSLELYALIALTSERLVFKWAWSRIETVICLAVVC